MFIVDIVQRAYPHEVTLSKNADRLALPSEHFGLHVLCSLIATATRTVVKTGLCPSDFIKASAPSRAERSWQLLTDQGLEEEGAGRVGPL